MMKTYMFHRWQVSKARQKIQTKASNKGQHSNSKRDIQKQFKHRFMNLFHIYKWRCITGIYRYKSEIQISYSHHISEWIIVSKFLAKSFESLIHQDSPSLSFMHTMSLNRYLIRLKRIWTSPWIMITQDIILMRQSKRTEQSSKDTMHNIKYFIFIILIKLWLDLWILMWSENLITFRPKEVYHHIIVP